MLYTKKINPAIQLLGIERNENICPQKNVYIDVHSNITHNSQKVGIIQISINL